MARDGSFIRQFIADFWDLLPKDDRDVLGAYWHGLTMAVADLYNEAFETALATTIDDVQVFRTERWNRYQLNSDTADIQSQTDALTLTGVATQNLSKDAVLFDSLTVSTSSGQIFFEQTARLVDEVAVSLTYPNLLRESVRVLEGSAIFVEGRDYRLNLISGTLSRIEAAGIPNGTLVTIRYTHSAYAEGVDYVIDEINRTIARTATSNITSGDTVQVVYNHDNTEPDLMGGTAGLNATEQTFTDTSKDFTGVLPGRTITVTSGVNSGTYTVLEIISTIQIKITGSFTADDAAATYTINAFPYAITLTDDVSSIPTMQDLIIEPTILRRENVHYQIGTNKISFNATLPTTRTVDGPTMWAEETLLDEQTVYRNFGVLIDFFRESSQSYLNAVRGLWYAFWTGSTHENLLRGLHILIGLPFATEPSTVTAITTRETKVLDVSASADLSTDFVRDLLSAGAESITATDTIDLPDDPGFTSADIGRRIRITGSSAGNDGYYTIVTLATAKSVTVTPTTLSTEAAGFTAKVYKAVNLPTDRRNVFTYSSNLITFDHLGEILRITGSTFNDGDYTITEILGQSSVRVSPDFLTDEGSGGFTAEVFQVDDDTITLADADGAEQTFTVPTGLSATVAVGDSIEQFQRLTDGVRIFDKINTDNFVTLQIGAVSIQRFLTQNATAADETKALTLLEEHLWVPQVLTDAINDVTSIDEILTFLNNLKPQWTEFVFTWAIDVDETLVLVENLSPSDISMNIDLTTILRQTWPNIAQPGQTQYQGTTGQTLARTIRTPAPTAVAASGTIVAVAKANLVDTETFTLFDGVNVPVVFEFDLPPDGITGGRTLVDISADTTDVQVATRMVSAINGVGAGLALTASNVGGTSATVTIVNDVLGTIGNGPFWSDTVVDAGFIITQPSGGTGLRIIAPNLLEDTDGGFVEADEGRLATISGSGAGNDGAVVIQTVISSTQVLVASDFTADENTGFTLNIQTITQLQDTSATFTTDVAINDIVRIESGTVQGNYKVLEVVDNSNLIIYETAFDGPFPAAATDVTFDIISFVWFQDQGALDFLENFLHERVDGAVTAASTFTVNAAVDLQALGVQPGWLLVIKSGVNIDVYDILTIPTKTTLTVSGTFPTSPNSPEDYAISQAALKREDIVPTILEVLPI
jgi:hypothetical protein